MRTRPNYAISWTRQKSASAFRNPPTPCWNPGGMRKSLKSSSCLNGRDSSGLWTRAAAVNLNKNAEQFFDEVVGDIKHYADRGYRIYYVPVAKGNNIYYDDLQYSQRLEKALWEDVDFALLDWESDFDNFVKVLKWAKKVFSSRLHLYLIASFLWCDTKVYPYQRKILKMQKVINELL